MNDKVLSFIERHSMINKGDTVTVGLSGGADSTALLLCLFELKDKLGITLKAAHLNHCLRGEEADRDEEFSRNLCQKLGVTFLSKKVDVKTLAKTSGESTELAARRARYEFFDCLGGKIATAHTASDNLETVIFNLTRGTALKGLCGIPVIRGNIIRPLLSVTREETEEFCSSHGIEFVTDSTNLSDEYTRNKIRHKIVPLLKEINPSVETAVLRMTETLKCDNAFLEKKVNESLDVFSENTAPLDGLKHIDDDLLSRVLITKAAQLCTDFPDFRDAELMRNAVASGKGNVELQKSVFFDVRNGKASFKTDMEKKTHVYTVETVTDVRKNFKINSLFLKNSVDCDKIQGNLVLRNRIAGDKIRLYNRGVTKTLKQLFCEKKIPNEERDVLPIASDDNGVVWVYSFGVAERCAVDETTKRITHFVTNKD